MGDEKEANQPVLTPSVIEQINEKLAEASRYPYAEVILVLKRGALRFIRSGVSEPIRTEQ
jgi:hypothetical protein